MLARLSPSSSPSRSAVRPIPLSDLNHESFTDPDLAEDAAADCVCLFQAGSQDFQTVRTQKWYKRIWTQLTQGETRRLADNCQSVAEAQDLLARILKAHFEHTARTSVLATYIAAGLNQTAASGNSYTRMVIDIGEQQETLAREVNQSRTQGTHDPRNEYTWTEEHRLLLFKVMAAAATTDGQLEASEKRLLEFKLRDLELGDKARAEAERYLDHVTPLHGEVRSLESDEMKKVLFRHAVAMVLADGDYSFSEKYFIRDLARALQISADCVNETLKALEPIGSHMPAERIAELASSGRRSRATSTRASSAATPTTAEDQARALETALAELEPRLREWTHVLLGCAHHELISFMTQREEKINQTLDKDCSLEEGLNAFEDIFNPEEMDRDFSSCLAEARKMTMGPGAYLADQVDLIVEGELFETIASQFEEISESSVDPGAAVQKLLAKVAEVRQSVPTPILGGIKCGAIGFASVFLLGPLGWLAGAAGAWFTCKLDGEKVDRLVNSLGRAHDRVWETAARWAEKAAVTLQFLEVQINEALIASMRGKGCPTTVELAREIVESDLATWAAAEDEE